MKSFIISTFSDASNYGSNFVTQRSKLYAWHAIKSVNSKVIGGGTLSYSGLCFNKGHFTVEFLLLLWLINS